MNEERTPASRVLDAAIRVAAYPPRKPGSHVIGAKVWWPYLTELRDALDELGIEWRDYD